MVRYQNRLKKKQIMIGWGGLQIINNKHNDTKSNKYTQLGGLEKAKSSPPQNPFIAS